jgi:hypothetical protein
MRMAGEYSLSDVASVVRGDEGFGGNWAWIIIILLFLGGGNGVFGNRGNYATQEDVAGGFSTSTILSNQRELANNLFGLQNSMNQGFAGLNTTVLTQACGIERAIDRCCCETNRNLDAIRYEMSKNTCEIITNQNANTAQIINYLKDDKIHALELDNTALKFQLSQNAQSTAIIDALKTTTTA